MSAPGTIYILLAFRCLVQWWFIIVVRSAVIIIITDFSSGSLRTRPRFGPGPDVLFTPSPSIWLHPFGPRLWTFRSLPLYAFLPLSLASLSLSLSRGLASFPLYPTRSLFFLSREQRPDLRRLRRRNGFWKLDSRDVQSSHSTSEKPLSLLSPSFNAKRGHSIPITITDSDRLVRWSS